ncbi:MAG TPA: hypothetical protein QF700_08490 [Prochlorococcus sp.]|nr:hypothetical protein [Prochlorococcus sp.]
MKSRCVIQSSQGFMPLAQAQRFECAPVAEAALFVWGLRWLWPMQLRP